MRPFLQMRCGLKLSCGFLHDLPTSWEELFLLMFFNLSAASQRDSWLQIFLTCHWQLFKCLNLDCYFNQVFGKTVNFL